MGLPEFVLTEIETTKQKLLTLDVIGLLANPKIFGGSHGGTTTFNEEAREFQYYYDQMAVRGYEIVQVRPDIIKPDFIQLGPAAEIITPANFGQVLLAQPEIQLFALLEAIVLARNFSIGSERQSILSHCITELEQSLQYSARHETLYFKLTSNLEIEL